MRILIFSGGQLRNWALPYIEEHDLLIGVDSGTLFLMKEQLPIHLAIGDFDSITELEKEKVKKYAKRYISCDPVHKNETDTEMAVKHAIRMQPEEIIIFGATGTRLDHTMANVHLLRLTAEHNIPCRIIDQWNEAQLVQDELTIASGNFSYISLLPLTTAVTGITLIGFEYTLEHATITLGQTIGISNKLKGKFGKIMIESGLLLVIKSKDDTSC